MKIFLVGLPGSGKTTLGKQVAASLSVPFVDLDQEIESVEGSSVKHIFSEKGEEYFRNLEAKTLYDWAFSDRSFVMATGGGAPCFNNGMEIINESGISIYLDVPVEEIMKRMHQEAQLTRPLLADESNLEGKLKKLLAQRSMYYGQAHFTFSGGSIKAQDIIDKIY